MPIYGYQELLRRARKLSISYSFRAFPAAREAEIASIAEEGRTTHATGQVERLRFDLRLAVFGLDYGTGDCVRPASPRAATAGPKQPLERVPQLLEEL